MVVDALVFTVHVNSFLMADYTTSMTEIVKIQTITVSVAVALAVAPVAPDGFKSSGANPAEHPAGYVN